MSAGDRDRRSPSAAATPAMVAPADLPPPPREPMAGAIALVLRGGVMLAAAVGLIGGVLFLIRHGHEVPHYRVFRGEPSEYRSLVGVLGGTFAEQGRAIVQLAVMILIAVPVVRVALALFGYLRERDWPFIAVTLVVLAILVHGLVAG